MRYYAWIGTALLSGAAFVACGGDTGGTGGSTTTSATGTGGTGTTGSTTTSATGTGGTGTTSSSTTSATGGTGTTSSTTSATGGTGTTSSSTTSGTGGTGPSPTADHLVISEVSVAPAEGEWIEIWNPTGAAVDLSNYYLSDNATYYGIAAGKPFAPTLATAGTDFLVQFPAGTMLPADGVIVVAANAGFEAKYTRCPDFILSANALPCTTGMAKAMVVPTNGAIGNMVGLSNAREMVVLFRFSPGTVKVEDVDYVTWGPMFDAETRIDKTAVTGYQPDTAAANQKAAPAPNANESIERCGNPLEPGEKTTGGNGLNGHDVTSESLDVSFVIQAAPTPGVKNTCL